MSFRFLSDLFWKVSCAHLHQRHQEAVSKSDGLWQVHSQALRPEAKASAQVATSGLHGTRSTATGGNHLLPRSFLPLVQQQAVTHCPVLTSSLHYGGHGMLLLSLKAPINPMIYSYVVEGNFNLSSFDTYVYSWQIF